MSNHTPGPWRYEEPATISAQAPTNGEWYDIITCHSAFELGQGKANAKLIAAAPETAAERDALKASNADLLAHLKQARECIAYCRRAHKDSQTGDGIPIEGFIDAAITRAEGRS
jgi:hypothetical protein